MIKFRAVILIGLLVVFVCCVADLCAGPVQFYTCCGANADCGSSGSICCDASYIGRVDCSPEMTGYCMASCIPGGSNSSLTAR